MSSSSGGGSASGMATQPARLLDESPPPQAATAANAGSPAVSMIAPEQVLAGKDFGVSISLAGAEALPAGELELNYDANALELLDGGEKSGDRVLKLGKGGGAVELRFRQSRKSRAQPRSRLRALPYGMRPTIPSCTSYAASAGQR